MEYIREELDRSNGQLQTVTLGNYITVTELGETYGVGPKRVRYILHHMGLLRREGCRYRLPRGAVEKGLGIRHDKPRSGYPFDVISPQAQQLIADLWEETVTDLDKELLGTPAILEAKEALEAFKTGRRRRKMTTQQEVCWLCCHREHLTHRQMAVVLSITEQLVGRYANGQAEQIAFHQRNKRRELPQLTPDEVRTNRLAGLEREGKAVPAPLPREGSINQWRGRSA